MEALDLFSVETEYLNTLLQKLICKSIVPNVFRKQRGIFYQKKIHQETSEHRQKSLRHEEAYCNEKNGFKLSAAENSTEISGQLRK